MRQSSQTGLPSRNIQNRNCLFNRHVPASQEATPMVLQAQGDANFQTRRWSPWEFLCFFRVIMAWWMSQTEVGDTAAEERTRRGLRSEAINHSFSFLFHFFYYFFSLSLSPSSLSLSPSLLTLDRHSPPIVSTPLAPLLKRP